MDLLRLEQQRQALDENLQRLRQSLKHWQTWEAEYEGLKEELLQREGTLSSDDFEQIADSYGGELVNATEVRDLTGLKSGSQRTVKQIVSLIEHRQDYVQKNIETVQRQFFDAEAKQEELAFVTATSSTGNDDDIDGENTRSLPLTEIHEELDEDGNIISTHLSRPEEDTSGMIDSLRKAGLTQGDLNDVRPSTETRPRSEELKPAITNASPVPSVNPASILPEKRTHSDTAVTTSGSDHDEPERPSIRKKSVSFTADTKAPTERFRPESEEGRKSVSFAEKVAVMPAAPAPDTRSVSFSPKVEEIPPQEAVTDSPEMTASNPDKKIIPIQADFGRQKELRESHKPGDKVIQLDDDDEIESVQVVLPENESAEDAATRREMLEYHLNEVGHVVAQMDLDESVFGTYEDEDVEDEEDADAASYHTSSEYLDDEEDTPYTTGVSESEDDEEDSHGRSTRRAVSEDYRKQMLDLQDRLIGNLGPAPQDDEIKQVDPDLDPSDVRRLVIREKRASVSTASSDSSEKKTGNGKKRVSFAESVDIAQSASATSGGTAAPPLKAQKHQEGENVAPVVSEKVAERSTAASHSIPPTTIPAAAPGKKSRFMKARAVPGTDDVEFDEAPTFNSQTLPHNDAPTGPPGRTLADTLTERVPSQKSAVAPSAEGDNDDPVSDRRQLAAEYYKRRNEIIQQQPGGFRGSADEDDELGVLMEEREDGKVRRVSRFKAARIQPQ